MEPCTANNHEQTHKTPFCVLTIFGTSSVKKTRQSEMCWAQRATRIAARLEVKRQEDIT